MLLTYIGFYGARKAQGLTNGSLSYIAPSTPYTPITALTTGRIAILFLGFHIFSPFSMRVFVTFYLAIAFTEGKRIVDLKSADLITGKA